MDGIESTNQDVAGEIGLEDQYALDQQRADKVEPIVRAFLSGGPEELTSAIEYLRQNPDSVDEFALQVKDSYDETDKYTSVLRLAEVIKNLL